MTTTPRTMYDSVTASREPNDGEIYLYYADGIYANEASVKADHPGKLYVGCAVKWTTRAQILDRENGDATAAEAVKWCTITMADKQNSELTIYANTSDWPGVVAAFKAAGVTLPQWLAAQYDGKRVIPAGAIGKQYLNTAGFDESIVAAYWPGVDSSGGKVVVPVATGPVTFRGVTLDPSTVTKLELAERLVGFTLSFPQGSYSSGVAASAGTHDGGGAVDVHCNTYSTADKVKLVHNLRAVGFAAWHRPYNWDGAGGSEHVHCEEIGNPHLSSGARAQIVQWNAHENGLANHGADTESVDVAAGRPTLVTSVPVPDIPQPKNTPLPEDTMVCIITYPKGAGWKGDFSFDGATLHHLKTEQARTALQALGVPVKNLNTANFNAMYAEYPHS